MVSHQTIASSLMSDCSDVIVEQNSQTDRCVLKTSDRYRACRLIVKSTVVLKMLST